MRYREGKMSIIKMLQTVCGICKANGKIDWDILLYNTAIFEIDYNALYKRIEPFKEQQIAECFHPKRLFYYLDSYNYDIGEEEYQD